MHPGTRAAWQGESAIADAKDFVGREALPRRSAVFFIVCLGIVSLFGNLGDRTGRYGAVTIGGYPIRSTAPGSDRRVANRGGPYHRGAYRRGIRSPVTDGMLSHAATQTGLRWGFGLQQALDQLGAVLGPLIVSGVLFIGSGYRTAFGFGRRVAEGALPVPPAAGAGALVLGSLFDRIGTGTMIVPTVISAAASPLVFRGNLPAAAIGMACWGLGTGAQDSIMRATIARLAPQQRRATAFGIMNAVDVLAWFAGSVLLGALDDIATLYLVLASALLQMTRRRYLCDWRGMRDGDLP